MQTQTLNGSPAFSMCVSDSRPGNFYEIACLQQQVAHLDEANRVLQQRLRVVEIQQFSFHKELISNRGALQQLRQRAESAIGEVQDQGAIANTVIVDTCRRMVDERIQQQFAITQAQIQARRAEESALFNSMKELLRRFIQEERGTVDLMYREVHGKIKELQAISNRMHRGYSMLLT